MCPVQGTTALPSTGVPGHGPHRDPQQTPQGSHEARSLASAGKEGLGAGRTECPPAAGRGRAVRLASGSQQACHHLPRPRPRRPRAPCRGHTAGEASRARGREPRQSQDVPRHSRGGGLRPWLPVGGEPGGHRPLLIQTPEHRSPGHAHSWTGTRTHRHAHSMHIACIHTHTCLHTLAPRLQARGCLWGFRH